MTVKRGFPDGQFAIYVLIDPRRPECPRYVGWTILRPMERLYNHIAEARRVTHTRRARWINSLLAAGIRPSIRVVELTANCDEAEKRWIARLRAKGYPLTNGTDGGKGGVLGARWTLTQEQRQAIGARTRGKRVSAEERQRLQQIAAKAKPWLGKRLPQEIRERAIANLAAYRDKAHEANRRQWAARKAAQPPAPPKLPGMTGKKHSLATRAHWSEIRRGRKQPAETIAKRAEALRGHPTSQATRDKIAAAQRARWARQKER